MDRGLVGILLICFISSTVIAALFFGLKPSEKVTLIRLDAFKGQPERTRSYTIELLAREPAERVTVEFSYLLRVSEERHDELSGILDVESVFDSGGEALTEIPKVEEELRMMKRFASSPGYRHYGGHAQYKDVFHHVRYELAVLDIREFFKYLPPSAGPEAYGSYLVFAVLRHAGNVSFYEGASDFYLNRLGSMGEVKVERRNESWLYENPNVIIPRSSEYVHVREAPSFGTVVFENVGTEETLRVIFTTRHLSGPGMLVARLWVDGEVQDDYFNLVGWPEREY